MPMANVEEQRKYQREWIAKRRQEWIDSQGGVCVECGSTDRLEIDHIDASIKSMNPSGIWSRRKEIREAELAKCQVLCESCHIEKTREQFYQPYCKNGHLKSEVGVYSYRKIRSDGTTYIDTRCKVCHNEKRNARRRKTDPR